MKPSIKMPTLQLQQSRQDTGGSLLISLLRGAAGVEVTAAHLRAELFPSLRTLAHPSLWYQALAFFTGFAHQAVVVFVLISGWLVGGGLLSRIGQADSIKSYAIDRVVRLWTVLVPGFLLMLLLGLGIGVLRPGTFDLALANPYSLPSFLGNLVGLQTIVVERFGDSYVLTTLAGGTWYFILFPLLLVSARSGGFARPASAAAILLIAALLPAEIGAYFSLWLLGAACSRLRLDCGKSVRATLLAVFGCVSVYFRLTGSNDNLVVDALLQDIVFSLPLLLLLSSLQFGVDPASVPLRRINSLSTFFASFAFSLYVLHVPMIGVLRHAAMALFGTDRLSPAVPLDYAIYFGMLCCILVCAYLFYLMFESHTRRIQTMLKALLLRPPPVSGGAAALRADS
jgi:hypothetical protein